MHRLKDLIALGKIARNQIEDINNKAPLHRWISPLSATLAGACGIASIFLLEKAKKRNMNPTFVSGTFSGEGHCWVQYYNHIIDLTATQFISCNKVHVMHLKNAPEYCGDFRSQDIDLIWKRINNWTLYPPELKSLI